MDETRPNGMKVLVSAASKHGATTEIAERIGAVLMQRGIAVDVADPTDVGDVAGYNALILGSAVYAGHWMESAKALANRIGGEGSAPDTWLFSSGPIGDPPQPEGDPVDVADIIAATSALDHRVLAGKIDKSKLSFAEKAILIAVRSPEGDFRDWEEIEGWAGSIADSLSSRIAGATAVPHST
jgi:menaquinone-dependent protoporphyrinogen oxidase